MILLHAVTRPPVRPTDADGLRVHSTRSVSVLFSEGTPPATSAADLVAHGRRLTALAERLPLLPVRYGTTVESPAELDALVAEREQEWCRLLDVVAGHRELLVHVTGSERRPDAPQPTTGREYLRRRADALHENDRVGGAVTEAVRPHAHEQRALPDGRRLAVLVAPSCESTVRAAVEAVAREEGRDIAVTGPWPAFSFCEEPPAHG